ncbi:hypothetical protein J6590_034244 [Homalodisca vitripennis]|nr:hypothetical protein J6590_034244 [Homalodisca vitripennis]
MPTEKFTRFLRNPLKSPRVPLSPRRPHKAFLYLKRYRLTDVKTLEEARDGSDMYLPILEDRSTAILHYAIATCTQEVSVVRRMHSHAGSRTEGRMMTRYPRTIIK